MRIAIVDDEKYAILALEEILRKLDSCQIENTRIEIESYRLAEDFLDYLSQNRVDIAFLDIEMTDMNGLELAKKVKELQPDANMIFVTGYSEYALKAHGLYVSGFLLKPPTEESVMEALRHLRNPVTSRRGALRVQCFGNFEVFYQDVPLKFKYRKTKELLAYLIDRKGAAATTGELCSVLFEDRAILKSTRSYFRNLVIDLTQTLENTGAKEVLVKSRNSFAVDVSRMDCDYYRYLQQEVPFINLYGGEYMSQYSWAEMTLGLLERQRI